MKLIYTLNHKVDRAIVLTLVQLFRGGLVRVA